MCAEILTRTGAATTAEKGRFTVGPATTVRPVIDADLGRRVRTTAVLAAAVLARAGQVVFPYPGGDAFCPRLIDRHLAAMQAAGARVTADATGLHARAPRGRLHPFTVDVATPYGPSLGATVTALLLAARTPGTSRITHPSIEPEVTETARFLAERGATVDADQGGLHVTGHDWIAGGTFAVAGDRIEAATMIMMAAATGGSITLDGISTTDLPQGLTEVFAAAGLKVADGADGALRAHHHSLRAAQIATGPHPGVPTDTAPQLAALLTQAQGTSLITERVYPRRDTHCAGLRAFGADLTSRGPAIRVHGPVRLRAAQVAAGDIRAVTALLIAALAADGTSTIRGTFHLRRGYGHLLTHLATLGADITQTTEEAP
ncbi:hypothetical protein [Streptomyces sp. NPDC045470]|uniref:hypothetical protein n=1 Tax=Streptomyces sp. NPDC045470 TaxID=3155469 RepID=UPI00340875BB